MLSDQCLHHGCKPDEPIYVGKLVSYRIWRRPRDGKAVGTSVDFHNTGEWTHEFSANDWDRFAKEVLKATPDSIVADFSDHLTSQAHIGFAKTLDSFGIPNQVISFPPDDFYTMNTSQ